MSTPDWESTRRELIETYKILNMEYRGADEEKLAAEHNGTSIKSILRKMRDDELLFAKALKERLLGDSAGASLGEDETPIIGNEVENETGRILISQFGSARATTLNAMTSADEETRARPLDGNKTMLDLAKELVESDRHNLKQIRAAA